MDAVKPEAPTPETDAIEKALKQETTDEILASFYAQTEIAGIYMLARKLERQRNAERIKLADICQQLKGLPHSKLESENGLAAATMRGFENAQAENEAMKMAIRDVEPLIIWLTENSSDLHHRTAADALSKLQPFLSAGPETQPQSHQPPPKRESKKSKPAQFKLPKLELTCSICNGVGKDGAFECPSCEGLGTALTPVGVELMDFIARTVAFRIYH